MAGVIYFSYYCRGYWQTLSKQTENDRVFLRFHFTAVLFLKCCTIPSCVFGRYSVTTVAVFNVSICCVLLACQSMSYGEGCRLTCDCGGAPCDPVTGQCICPAGKTGHSCHQGTFILYVSLIFCISFRTFYPNTVVVDYRKCN